MMAVLKERLLGLSWFHNRRLAFRSSQLHRQYAARRELYAAQAEEQGLVYDKAAVADQIRERMKRRGYSPAIRAAGDVHTFAFVPVRSWHHHLLPDLRELGPLSLFDYEALGYPQRLLWRSNQNARQMREEINTRFFSALSETHRKHPVDWVFVYANGFEVSAKTLRKITEELGVPTVNMCLDDKQSWDYAWLGDQHAGQVNIGPLFDVSWTSARVACEWYLVEGGRPIYMPEGYDQDAFKPVDVRQDIPVSFVGGAYGFRPSVVKYLRAHGIPVQVFGSGWPDAGWADEVVDIFNRSIVNLGMGGIGYSETLTNVKGRDFEIPGTGGGLYLTSFNPDLAQHFAVSEEIVCYRNRDEMLELIRYYLKHPDEARAIALRGRARCLREHRWLHRYMCVCKILGILPEVAAAEGDTLQAGKAQDPRMHERY